jgi:Family of unknown function (DUF5329)
MKRRTLLQLALAFGAAAHAAPPAAEQARIDRLIDAVAQQRDLQFVRNGKAYGSADAATFLRKKLESRGADVATAEQFIERIASSSGTSGQPYRIRFADGREVTSVEYLQARLKALDAKP